MAKRDSQRISERISGFTFVHNQRAIRLSVAPHLSASGGGNPL
jgi:hypothetical protein